MDIITMADIKEGRLGRLCTSNDSMQNCRMEEDSLRSNSRRGKPQVEIYRPGSGPLRKSASGTKADDEGCTANTDSPTASTDSVHSPVIEGGTSKRRPYDRLMLAENIISHRKNSKSKFVDNNPKDRNNMINSLNQDGIKVIGDNACDDKTVVQITNNHNDSNFGDRNCRRRAEKKREGGVTESSPFSRDKQPLCSNKESFSSNNNCSSSNYNSGSKKKNKKPDTPLYSVIKSKHQQHERQNNSTQFPCNSYDNSGCISSVSNSNSDIIEKHTYSRHRNSNNNFRNSLKDETSCQSNFGSSSNANKNENYDNDDVNDDFGGKNCDLGRNSRINLKLLPSSNNNSGSCNDMNDKSSKDFNKHSQEKKNVGRRINGDTNNYLPNGDYLNTTFIDNKNNSQISSLMNGSSNYGVNTVKIKEDYDPGYDKPSTSMERNGRKFKHDRRKRRGKGGGSGNVGNVKKGNEDPISTSSSYHNESTLDVINRLGNLSEKQDDKDHISLRIGEYISSSCDDVGRGPSNYSGRGMMHSNRKPLERKNCNQAKNLNYQNENMSSSLDNQRQNSEPRSLPLNHRYDGDEYRVERERDARSAEPADFSSDFSSNKNITGLGNVKIKNNRVYDNKYSAPYKKYSQPSVNNHRNNGLNKVSWPFFESLPPRLKKKYMAENGVMYNLNFIGNSNCGEDVWDGSSITFQGSNSSLSLNDKHHCDNPLTGPPSHLPQAVQLYSHNLQEQTAHHYGNQIYQQTPSLYSQRFWSHTLPAGGTIGSRGRGRLHPEVLKASSSAANMANNYYSSRPMTPETLVDYESYNRSNFNDKWSLTSSMLSLTGQQNCEKVEGEDYNDCGSNYDENGENICGDSMLNSNECKSTDDLESKELLQSRESDTSQRNKVDFKMPMTGHSLDWVEEVERSERLESDCNGNQGDGDNERLSNNDSVKICVSRQKECENQRNVNGRIRSAAIGLSSRSSSNSLQTQSANTDGGKKKREIRRRRKNVGGMGGKSDSNRSLSREDKKRHGSADHRFRNLPRGEKGIENVSWRANSNERHRFGNSSRSNSLERWRSGRGCSNERHRKKEGTGSRPMDRRGQFRNGSRDRRGRPNRSRRNSSGSSHCNSEETNWRNELRPQTPSSVIKNDNNKGIHGNNDYTESGANNRISQSLVSVSSGMEDQQQPGILVLPDAVINKSPSPNKDVPEMPTYPVFRGNIQRQLFNPNNPDEPIIVAAGNRGVPHMTKDSTGRIMQSSQQNADNSLRTIRNPHLLFDVEKCEYELMSIISSGHLIQYWQHVSALRHFLQEAQRVLLISELKFCQANNFEQYIWKLLFYNIIEHLRKAMTDVPENAEQYRQLIMSVINDGTKYYETLLENLQSLHKIKFDDYLQSNPDCTKGLGYVGLAIVSAQKLFLFLGDLARYKEQVNEGSNYGISRQWYIKAQQINPKNGRPYNQLALLAIYARRKLDAVYYYMRSLMSSNPVQSARESLLSMFDDNRKKYELTEKRRKEERDVRDKEKEKMKEKEELVRGRYRREVWIHPGGGERVLRTTSAAVTAATYDHDSEEEELSNMSYLSLNKRFGVSYLHVHGKLFTKVGMETFQETAVQMLKEFWALLQHSPLPLNSNRFLQLLALNMFAIENTQLKNDDLEPGYRSAMQEYALIISLQMFNLILARCVHLLKEQLQSKGNSSSTNNGDKSVHGDTESDLGSSDVNNVEKDATTSSSSGNHSRQNQQSLSVFIPDVQVLLPAIKVWCDWLLCHSAVWNPPPSCHDYRVGPPGDAWSRLAMLVNLLERWSSSSGGRHNHNSLLCTVQQPDSDLVRLPEDATLSGFTPLMSNAQDPIYTNKNNDMDAAQLCLRIKKILFFGSIFLCGVDPPVLKLQKYDTGSSEYVSVVETPSPPEPSDSDVCIESEISNIESDDSIHQSSTILDDDLITSPVASSNVAVSADDIPSLLHRKELLERSHRKQEKRREKVQAILRECDVTVEMEVRPHYLIPDTNCFIDYLPQLVAITKAVSPTGQEHLYTLMVPLVVLNELEGLSRGARENCSAPTRPQHAILLAEAARSALVFLRSGPHPSIRCVTTRGNVLSSSTFTAEEDADEDMKNDDRILATCLNLSRLSCRGGEGRSNNSDKDGVDSIKSGSSPRHVYSEVVLLTEDRNLKVKALSRDMPVSDMPHFMQWSGLSLDVELG